VARAKSTRRAEARRRYRAEQAAARAAVEDSAADEEQEGEPAQETPTRQPLFKIPNVREDLLALPLMFRQKPVLWLPIALMALGFALSLIPPPTDPTIRFVIQFYVQSFFLPSAILAIFLGGILAPRGSYLVGLLLGLINGLLLVAYVLVGPLDRAAVPSGDLPSVAFQAFIVPTLYGPVIGAFAGWYRDFLRRSSERRRAAVEARARERKREQKRANRPAR
jgi:hypothetical protein